MEKLDELNSGFCANMYAEARDIFIKGFPETRQDLFMEIRELSPETLLSHTMKQSQKLQPKLHI